jgi:diguanylate cyclase (GGDEF)-like protein
MVTNLESKSSVLVVDDNENDRTTLCDILQTRGYQVSTATTGAEAITLAKEHDYDVILLDMRLPDMDGNAVMDRIKQFKPSAGIIAITGHSLDGMIENMVKKGAYTCLLKPFNVDMLLREIGYLIEKKDQEVPASGAAVDAAKILLVEDNDGLRETMKDIIEEEGYIVKTASSVPEAEKLVDGITFNMVISDLSLGNDSGLLLVDPVRRKDKFTIFLLVTGYGTMETALEAIKKDVDEYILKPVKPNELVHKIKSYMEKQRLNREKESLVQKLQESNLKLLEHSKTDELTGVSNRRSFFERLHSEMQRARRQNTDLGLMMCDVDGFKRYNDTAGHLEGDKVLREISTILRIAVREHVDEVFRYGGDEFAIIVPGMPEESAEVVASRLISSIKQKLEGKNIGLSIGISCLDLKNTEMTLNEFIDAADKKLYDAKKAGGNRAIG